MTSKCKTCDTCNLCKCEKFQPEDDVMEIIKKKAMIYAKENDEEIYKGLMEKQKKGSSEDVPKEMINPMKDMVRNGKDWKQKGCNCYGICLDKSCSNQSPRKEVNIMEHKCNKDCIVSISDDKTQKCIHHNDGGVTIHDIE